MNIKLLPWGVNLFRTQGFSIDPHNALLLAASLKDLKVQLKFRDVYVWGKIFGNKASYYVAFGYKSDILHSRYHFYSRDCIRWRQLGRTSRRDHQMALMVEEPFTGNPEETFAVTPSPEEAALMAELAAQGDEDEGDEMGKSQLMEETRLAAVIALINWEATCVPRGSIVRREDGWAIPNDFYVGLSWDEATDLRSYMHFRPPRRSVGKNLRMRADHDLPYDFMDSLSTDTLPSHSVWVDDTDAMAVVRSLAWPGAVTLHIAETPTWAFLYVGGAQRKTLDLPHLLPTSGAVPPLRRPPPPAPPATPITERTPTPPPPPGSPKSVREDPKGPLKSLLGDDKKKPAHTPEGAGLPSQKDVAKKWHDARSNAVGQALAEGADDGQRRTADSDTQKRKPSLGKTPKPVCKKDKDPKRPPSVVAVPNPYYDSSPSTSESEENDANRKRVIRSTRRRSSASPATGPHHRASLERRVSERKGDRK